MSEPTHPEYQAHKGARPAAEAASAGKLKPTPSDIEGPFYLPDAPYRDNLVDEPTMLVTGNVLDTDGELIHDALLDFWQADESGNYDEHGPAFRCRMNAGSYYRLGTVRPGPYKISETEFRCSHIHVKVTAPGCRPLTTQLYFADDPHNGTDHWFSADRVIGPDGRFDFVLARE